MKKFRLLLVALFAALHPADAGRPDEDPYEPLAVGLRWESSVEVTLPSGETLRGTAVREITGTEIIGGKTYFVSVTHYTGLAGLEPLITYQRKTVDGIYTVDPQLREYRECVLPLAVGQTWTVEGEARALFRVECEQRVEVAGRLYERCLKVVFRSQDGTSHGAYYVAPRIGIVLDTAEEDGTRYRFSLLSFRDQQASREQ